LFILNDAFLLCCISLLDQGYSLEQIVAAAMEADMARQSRAESLKSAGWSNPMELLNGAAETTGMALKSIDVLGVGTMVGAGAAVGFAVVGAGTDMTVQTGRMLVNGVTNSTKAVAGGVSTVGAGVLDAGKFVGVGVVDAGKSMGNVVRNSVTTTGKAIRKLSPKRPSAVMT
jgi:hypothetical protein